MVRNVDLAGEFNGRGFEDTVALVFKLWAKTDITKEQSTRLAVIYG